MPKINPLNTNQISEITQQKKTVEAGSVGDALRTRDFGQTISDFIQAVNNKQISSQQQVADVIEGRSENLHQAMASLEEARLSFQLMIEIRNKLLESYKTLERMQI